EKYKAFLRRFPSIESVARAPLRDVLEVWQGLGYNRRALALKRLATIIVDEYGGKIPPDIEALKALPGVGAATAGAVCAFAFDKLPYSLRRISAAFSFIIFSTIGMVSKTVISSLSLRRPLMQSDLASGITPSWIMGWP
ncbi:MAG: hypothetical protein P8Y09_10485, partial [Deltaproteobacteria bacterium]